MLMNSKAYELGIAHMLLARKASAFRNRFLKPYGLSSAEWFILGLIQSKSAAGGIRVTDLANALDVQTTYITASVNVLRSGGYVDTLKDLDDARARLLVITKKGNEAFSAIEKSLTSEIDKALKGKVTREEFANYVHVIQAISRCE
jgi:DNA-binding MarR family transcriptional regulator